MRYLFRELYVLDCQNAGGVVETATAKNRQRTPAGFHVTACQSNQDLGHPSRGPPRGIFTAFYHERLQCWPLSLRLRNIRDVVSGK